MPRRTTAQPITSILCPVDFSPHSRAALEYAARVARDMRAPLTVLFVNDPLLSAVAAIELDARAVADRSAAELRGFIRKTIKPGARIDVRAEQAIGDPAKEILAVARRRRADLIVLGTEGLSGLKKLFFGSTALGVVHRTPIPVVLVTRSGLRARRTGRPAPWPGRRVLAPLDLGRQSEQDARSAAAIARHSNADLTLVHVVAPVQPPPWFSADAVTINRIRRTRARTRLDGIAAAVGVADARIMFGAPAEMIALAARQLKSDLVVMPLRGGDGLLRARPGSIAYRVLCDAHIPVLVLPPRRAKSARERRRS
jgi:universal stress protein A